MKCPERACQRDCRLKKEYISQAQRGGFPSEDLVFGQGNGPYVPVEMWEGYTDRVKEFAESHGCPQKEEVETMTEVITAEKQQRGEIVFDHCKDE